VASLRRLQKGFPVDAAIGFLAGFVVVELFSFVGWWPSVTSTLPYPIGKLMSLASSSIGLLGIYGLLKSNKTGAYFALLASVFETVLGCFSLIKAYEISQLSLALAVFTVTPLALGTLTLICIFKTSLEQPNTVNGKLDASSSSDCEKFSGAGSEYAIETVNVTKKYFLGSNVVSAINGLSMKIRKGEFVAVMGPSGSGKSTLLNLIGALDKPSSGKVLIDGIDISTLDEAGLAKLRNEKIGFVFQAYNLISRSSVLRNMELPALVKGFPREERMRRIKELLDIVGLIDKLPRKPKTLSGGEQQRVAIARALINDPEIVLADEPTGNVDSKQGLIIMEFLRKLNLQRGTTIIVVTHDPDVAKMTDRIVYIRDGKIVKEEIVRGISR